MTSISGLSRGTVKHTYYDILEISPDATNQQVKDAYKRLAILKHPDKNLGDTLGACAAFQQLQTAYDTLSEPSLRTKYDASVIPRTTKAATPRNRRSSPQAPRRRRPTTPRPQRPSRPARPTTPKSRCPKIPPPEDHVAYRPSWLSTRWYEMAINHSVRKERMYQDDIISLENQGKMRAVNETYHLLAVELGYQGTLSLELKAKIAGLRGSR